MLAGFVSRIARVTLGEIDGGFALLRRVKGGLDGAPRIRYIGIWHRDRKLQKSCTDIQRWFDMRKWHGTESCRAAAGHAKKSAAPATVGTKMRQGGGGVGGGGGGLERGRGQGGRGRLRD